MNDDKNLPEIQKCYSKEKRKLGTIEYTERLFGFLDFTSQMRSIDQFCSNRFQPVEKNKNIKEEP